MDWTVPSKRWILIELLYYALRIDSTDQSLGLFSSTRANVHAIEVHSKGGRARKLFTERRPCDHLDTLPQHFPHAVLQESRYGLRYLTENAVL